MSQQDEKSQVKNRAKAMKVLRSRLYEMEMRKQQDAIAKDRRTQVGTGERSEKIRTYNFKENRITDHRIGFTMHQLTEALDGDLDELIDAAVTHFTSEKLKEATDRRSRRPDGRSHERLADARATRSPRRAFRPRTPRSTRRCSRATSSAGIAPTLVDARARPAAVRLRRAPIDALVARRAAASRSPTSSGTASSGGSTSRSRPTS